METVDWQGMNVGQSYSLIEPGMYLVEINDWKKKEASTGTPQIEWLAKICEGDLDGTPVHDFTALSSAALWRLGSLVQSCGIDLKTLPKMIIGSEEFNRVCNALKGRKVYWDITQDSYKGKPNNKVAGYMPYEDQEAAPDLTADTLPSFIKNKNAKATPMGFAEPTAEQKKAAKKAGLIGVAVRINPLVIGVALGLVFLGQRVVGKDTLAEVSGVLVNSLVEFWLSDDIEHHALVRFFCQVFERVLIS